jgi:hypothetical protein
MQNLLEASTDEVVCMAQLDLTLHPAQVTTEIQACSRAPIFYGVTPGDWSHMGQDPSFLSVCSLIIVKFALEPN